MPPYKSEQQRKFFHTNTAKKAGIKKSTVEEFDKESKGLKLPRFSKMKKSLKGVK